MVGEESTAFFHWRESPRTLVRMSFGGKKAIMCSKSSEVLKTALRTASVVMLRVWRRGVAAIALRFCLPRETCMLVGNGCELLILSEPALPFVKRAMFVDCREAREGWVGGQVRVVACIDHPLSRF